MDLTQIAFDLLTPLTDAKIVVVAHTFAEGKMMPDEHSAYFDNRSPALSWGGMPIGTHSIVLICDDPDAASVKPVVHWVVADIPPTVEKIPAGIPKTERAIEIAGAVQGLITGGEVGYRGPRPPAAPEPHHYHFQVFALDKRLEIQPGFDRAALLAQMDGHVLAKGQTIGLYRKPDGL